MSTTKNHAANFVNRSNDAQKRFIFLCSSCNYLSSCRYKFIRFVLNIHSISIETKQQISIEHYFLKRCFCVLFLKLLIDFSTLCVADEKCHRQFEFVCVRPLSNEVRTIERERKREYLFVNVRNISVSSVRWNSTQATAPRKITTHYTIYPREKDERWKGNAFRSFFLSDCLASRCEHGTLCRGI